MLCCRVRRDLKDELTSACAVEIFKTQIEVGLSAPPPAPLIQADPAQVSPQIAGAQQGHSLFSCMQSPGAYRTTEMQCL